jgi:hypothetical protein
MLGSEDNEMDERITALQEVIRQEMAEEDEADEMSHLEYYSRISALSADEVRETSTYNQAILRNQIRNRALPRASGLSAAEQALISAQRISFVLDQPVQRILYSSTTLPNRPSALASSSAANHLDISPNYDGETDQRPFQDISRLRRLIALRQDVLGWCINDEEEESSLQSAPRRHASRSFETSGSGYIPSSTRLDSIRQQYHSSSGLAIHRHMDPAYRQAQSQEFPIQAMDLEGMREINDHAMEEMYRDEAVQTLSITGTSVPYYSPSIMESMSRGLRNLEAQNIPDPETSTRAAGVSIIDLVSSLSASYPVAHTFKALFAEEISKIEMELLDSNGVEIGEEEWTLGSVISSAADYRKMKVDLGRFRFALNELEGVVPVGR